MLELAVKLPAALPLRPPELECRRKVGGCAAERMGDAPELPLGVFFVCVRSCAQGAPWMPTNKSPWALAAPPPPLRRWACLRAASASGSSPSRLSCAPRWGGAAAAAALMLLVVWWWQVLPGGPASDGVVSLACGLIRSWLSAWYELQPAPAAARCLQAVSPCHTCLGLATVPLQRPPACVQNGSVAEAISLWKRNVDKEFEGGAPACCPCCHCPPRRAAAGPVAAAAAAAAAAPLLCAARSGEHSTCSLPSAGSLRPWPSPLLLLFPCALHQLACRPGGGPHLLPRDSAHLAPHVQPMRAQRFALLFPHQLACRPGGVPHLLLNHPAHLGPAAAPGLPHVPQALPRRLPLQVVQIQRQEQLPALPEP